MSIGIELDGFVDRVTTGRGGDIDQLLDVPLGCLGLVGVDIEATAHPRRIGGAVSLRAGEVWVPVGASGIPEVHVSVDDTSGLGRHQASTCAWSLAPATTSRSVPSGQRGTAGPPQAIGPIAQR